MNASIAICEGLRDRVVIAQLLTTQYGWERVASDERRMRGLYQGKPFYSGQPNEGSFLFRRSDRYLVVLERSKSRQRETVGDLIRLRLGSDEPEKRPPWQRLLVVFDADAVDSTDSAEELIQRQHQRAATLFRHDKLQVGNTAALIDEWQEAELEVAERPPGHIAVRLRAVVLPRAESRGSLESLLLEALASQSHSQLIASAREFVQGVSGLKKEYEKSSSEHEKSLIGVVLASLDPELTYSALERRLERIPWGEFPAVVAALKPLAEL